MPATTRSQRIADEGGSQSPLSDDSNLVWYFGFGSNMNPKVFGAESSRYERRVIPRTAKVGKVPGWALRFNLKTLPLVEPGMGNIIKEEGAEVHGVAYQVPAIPKRLAAALRALKSDSSQITEQDLEKIFRSEGGGTSDAYTIQTLDFYGYDGMHLQVKVPPPLLNSSLGSSSASLERRP
jgi:cation transport regulator ChaC